MSARDVIIGIIILAALAVLISVGLRKGRPALKLNPPPSSSVEQKIESRFHIQIPENVEKADLRDVSGGAGEGIATRESQNGKYIYTILANLEEPTSGSFYQGWLVRGKPKDSNYSVLSIGRLRVAKGGWLGEYQSSTNYSDYQNVLVTLEKVYAVSPGKHILEGSF